MDAYYGINQATNSWAGLTATADFRERVSYDGNGNILGYKRNNFGETGLPMDSLHYNYITGTNKLDFIRDSASDAVAGGYDLHTQPGHNYAYDSIGNLIKDSSEKISSIKWNVYGKIIEINRSITSPSRPTKNIYYYYDAAGHRIGKKLVRGDTSAVTYTWYVRDASGNVMATYTIGGDSTTADTSDLRLSEQHIYGSSRLGILTANRSVDGNTTGMNNYISPWTGVHLPYYIGLKQYELANHLGNVLATITDKKIGVSLASDSSLIDHYEAEVKTAQDYYPFGMIMPGRLFTAISIPGGTYSGTTMVNGYTLPVDLTVSSRTGTTPSSYTATHSIDLEEGFESGTNDDVTAYIADGNYAGGGNGDGDNTAIAGTGKYRYGFNGKEKDNEVKGIGDQIDYGMRVYDPRVGRFMSVDPLAQKYPELTPYQYASNNPVLGVDLDGLEFLTSNSSRISISLRYDPKLKTIISASTYYRRENLPDALNEAIDNANTSTNGIGSNAAQVALFQFNVPKSKLAADLDATDIDSKENSAVGPSSQGTQIPINPKNKKEAREQEKTGKYFTEGASSRIDKLNVALAVIDVVTTVLQYIGRENVKSIVETAGAQSTYQAAEVIKIMQYAIASGKMDGHLDDASLIGVSNYLLYGAEINKTEIVNGNPILVKDEELTKTAKGLWVEYVDYINQEKQKKEQKLDRALRSDNVKTN